LVGKKILPQKVLDAGYDFKYKTLDDALKNIV
jgi:NAD dependent epimerase/dehydratase family enzyme